MIIEFTLGHFFMILGICFGIVSIIEFLLTVKNTDHDAELIIGIVFGIFSIILILIGLNIDYGFLVFKFVE